MVHELYSITVWKYLGTSKSMLEKGLFCVFVHEDEDVSLQVESVLNDSYLIHVIFENYLFFKPYNPIYE